MFKSCMQLGAKLVHQLLTLPQYNVWLSLIVLWVMLLKFLWPKLLVKLVPHHHLQ